MNRMTKSDTQEEEANHRGSSTSTVPTTNGMISSLPSLQNNGVEDGVTLDESSEESAPAPSARLPSEKKLSWAPSKKRISWDDEYAPTEDEIAQQPRRARNSVVTFASSGGRGTVDGGGGWSRMSTVGTTARTGPGGIQFHHFTTQSTTFTHHASFDLDSKAEIEGESNDNKIEYLEAITLPQSTHTLLFTEKINSVPFGFAFIILVVSVMCKYRELSSNAFRFMRMHKILHLYFLTL